MGLSWRAKLAVKLLPLAAPKPGSPEAQRKATDAISRGPGRGVVADDVRVGGVPCVQVRPDGPYPDAHVLHVHGGGFVVGTARTFLPMVGELSRRTGRVVTSVDYRLAPEHPHPAAIDDCLAAYRGLLADGPADRIVLAGESAGGNAVLALLVRARDEGVALPAGAVLFSPWLDLTFSGGSFDRNRATEALLSREVILGWRDAYVGDGDAADPAISPLFADLTGLPPLHVQATTAEILEDDARRLADRARAAGVEVDLVLHDELFHVFQTQSSLLPEARAAVGVAADFIRGAA